MELETNKSITKWMLCILFLMTTGLLMAQKQKPSKIKFLHSDLLEGDPKRYEGNPLATGKVVFEHDGTKLYCDSAVYYQETNFFRAWSNVRMINDTVSMTSDSLAYDGNTKIAKAFGRVHLKDKKSELRANYVDYNRVTEVANASGKVILIDPTQRIETEHMVYNRLTGVAETHSGAIITSKDGNKTYTRSLVYNVNTKVTVFDENVNIETSEYRINSEKMILNDKTKITQFFGYTTIASRKNPRNYITTTKGEFHERTGEAFLKERSTVYRDGKELHGNEMYFNDQKGYGWAKGDVLINDPEEKRFIKGDYGEAFRELDSAYVTGNAYAVKAFKLDSLYFHADTIMAVQRKDSTRLIRGYFNARFFKSDGQGKADSISYNETEGIMKFFRDPIFWSGDQQITGDTIYTYNNVVKEVMDSIRVNRNAFAISKVDSLTTKDFNQVKGKTMLGLFVDNELDWVEVQGNAESLNFVDDEDPKTNTKERIGINKSNCGIIEADVNGQEVDVLSCRIQAASKLYPESKLPENQRYLKDFNWREKEKMYRWQDIFIDSTIEDKTDEPLRIIESTNDLLQEELEKKP